MLKDKITTDRNIAMKDGNITAKLLLGTLLGELDRKTKNPSDSEVVAVIKKMKESCILCGKLDEVEILEKYIPSQYTSQELETMIGDYITTHDIQHKKDMGIIMKWLKENHNGLYDGKIASNIITNKLV